MSEGAAFRGQPLLLLVGLLLGWTMLRVALWQQPVGQPPPVDRLAQAEPPTPRMAQPGPAAPADAADSSTRFVAHRQQRAPVERSILTPPAVVLASVAPPLSRALALPGPPVAPEPGVAPAAPLSGSALPSQPATATRWSADGWLLLRRDTITSFLSGRPSHGRSQAGAVVRYGLAPGSWHRLEVHLRASTALAGAREQEVALGVSARPVAGLPLRLSAEARVSETVGGTRLRPAAYAVTELAPLDLPLGMRAEVYAQGGYVGGDFPTAFVDGQARVGRPLARLGGLELTANAGVWGGAQRDASRLDVGPSATVSFRLGKAYGRVAADYRFRVAGDAQPASGPALTVSAGF